MRPASRLPPTTCQAAREIHRQGVSGLITTPRVTLASARRSVLEQPGCANPRYAGQGLISNLLPDQQRQADRWPPDGAGELNLCR